MEPTFMYDSVDPFAIPIHARRVAGYVDGPKSAWTRAGWDRFGPGIVLVTITVTGNPGADVADCENGDLTDAEAAQWALVKNQRGQTGTIYRQASSWAATKAEVDKAGARADWWIGDWTGHVHELPGAAAVQYASPSTGSGGDYDLSVVSDPAWFPLPAAWQDQALAHLEAAAAILERHR
ncbi:MAG: hypothetical protein ACYCVZ_19380 [Streptosporangiaceae bacterium]